MIFDVGDFRVSCVIYSIEISRDVEKLEGTCFNILLILFLKVLDDYLRSLLFLFKGKFYCSIYFF